MTLTAAGGKVLHSGVDIIEVLKMQDKQIKLFLHLQPTGLKNEKHQFLINSPRSISAGFKSLNFLFPSKFTLSRQNTFFPPFSLVP